MTHSLKESTYFSIRGEVQLTDDSVNLPCQWHTEEKSDT